MIETIDSPYIHEASTDDFKSLVLDNSELGPVLVNFWSRKAGPCLRQYPILDKLIHHYAGRVLLINVDTEREYVITKEYGIASVPTLKLFRDRKVVETLHGFQSENDLIQVLDNYAARDSDQILAQAVKLYAQNKTVDAYELITEAIVNDPNNPRLPLAMCKLLKHEGRYADALKIIDSLPDTVRNNNEIIQFHNLLGFYVEIDPDSDMQILAKRIETEPTDLRAKQQLVAQHVTHEQYQQALQELVEIMQQDQFFDNNYAQKAMLRIFSILGSDHTLVSEYRHNLKRYTH